VGVDTTGDTCPAGSTDRYHAVRRDRRHPILAAGRG
jgi:hypothetical protein